MARASSPSRELRDLELDPRACAYFVRPAPAIPIGETSRRSPDLTPPVARNAFHRDARLCYSCRPSSLTGDVAIANVWLACPALFVVSINPFAAILTFSSRAGNRVGWAARRPPGRGPPLLLGDVASKLPVSRFFFLAYLATSCSHDRREQPLAASRARPRVPVGACSSPVSSRRPTPCCQSWRTRFRARPRSLRQGPERFGNPADRAEVGVHLRGLSIVRSDLRRW